MKIEKEQLNPQPAEERKYKNRNREQINSREKSRN